MLYYYIRSLLVGIECSVVYDVYSTVQPYVYVRIFVWVAVNNARKMGIDPDGREALVLLRYAFLLFFLCLGVFYRLVFGWREVLYFKGTAFSFKKSMGPKLQLIYKYEHIFRSNSRVIYC